MDVVPSIPGDCKAFAASGAISQVEVDERLIRDPGIFRLGFEIGDRLFGEFDRHLLLQLLCIRVLLSFAEIIFFPHIFPSPFVVTCFVSGGSFVPLEA